VEGHGPATCAAYVDAGFSWSREPFEEGQYTDDTQLARELLESWVSSRRFHPEDYAARVAALFRDQRVVGRGRATANAAHRLDIGVPWRHAGEPAPSAGNGSAMRSAPVGLMCAGDIDQLIQVACDQSRMTHSDPRCLAGATAIAAATRLAVLEPELRGAAALTAIAEAVQAVHEGFAEHLRWLIELLPRTPGEAAREVAALGRAAGDLDDGWRGISPFVVPSVLWALYAAHTEPADPSAPYMSAVTVAVRAGGDVDTTAAMAGAIAGARVGARGLPPRARSVHDRRRWGYSELEVLATRAWELSSQGQLT